MRFFKILSSLEELFLDLDLNPDEIQIITSNLINMNVCHDVSPDIQVRNIKDWIYFSIEMISEFIEDNENILRIFNKFEYMCPDDVYIINADDELNH